MMHSPDDALLPVERTYTSAGTFADAIAKAGAYAGQDKETRAVFAAAAMLCERHGRGYTPQDGDTGRLTAALGGWLAAMRERARAARGAEAA